MSLYKFGVALGLAVAVASAQAGSITTLFTSNNGGSNGGAVYFDTTIGAGGLTITGFDINTGSTSAFNFTVYTISGSYVGNTTNQSLWTQVATGSGVGAGLDLVTTVNMNNSFVLGAGQSYGIALVLDAGAGFRYTNGDGSNQNFSNSDLSLTLGAASNIPFTGTPFSPRVWNGTIRYSAVPEPASMVALGLGAAALIRRRRAAKK